MRVLGKIGTKSAIILGLIASSFAIPVVGGSAGQVSAACTVNSTFGNPYKSGNAANASFYYSNGSGCATYNMNHEVQRKDCAVWPNPGCQWLNGTDYTTTVAPGTSKTHLASRPLACNTHTYRHKNNRTGGYSGYVDLTLSC